MIDAAVAAIRDGHVVGLPTDTVYGLGADPLNDDAVEGLYELKGRPEHKPVGILAASFDQAVLLGEIEGVALQLANRHWPGALTLVVTPLVVLADWVGDAQRRTVGVRVPDHPLARRLLEETGPLAVTSANLSGGHEAVNAEEARAIFGDRVTEYLPGFSPGGEASTVVDVSGARPSILRQGPVEV